MPASVAHRAGESPARKRNGHTCVHMRLMVIRPLPCSSDGSLVVHYEAFKGPLIELVEQFGCSMLEGSRGPQMLGFRRNGGA